MSPEQFISTQGNSIALSLQRHGYEIRRIKAWPGWAITHPDQEWLYVLTFLPPPVAQWRLLPATFDPAQTKLYSVIEGAIGGRR